MLLQTSDHRLLFPGSALIGAIVMLLCDTISQLPGSANTLPINAVTSLFGAPVVIWLILKRNFSKEF
jgi:iron complex transport system permease protein